MKITVAFFSAIFFFAHCFAQPFSSFYLNESSSPTFYFTDNYIYISYNSTPNNLIKTDYQGNIIWTKEGHFYPRAINDSEIYSLIYDSVSMGILKTDTG